MIRSRCVTKRVPFGSGYTKSPRVPPEANNVAAPVAVERDLIEIDVGERTGAAFDEVRGLPDWKDDGFVAWPGGETLEQVLERGLRAVRRLARELPHGRVLVIGHGGVTRILVSHFLGILPRLDRSPATNTNITVIVTDGDRGRVERLFESAHVAERLP